MSLFPAYSSDVKPENSEKNQDWLTNSSCPEIEKVIKTESQSCSENHTEDERQDCFAREDIGDRKFEHGTKHQYSSADSSIEDDRPDKKKHKKEHKHKKKKHSHKRDYDEFLKKSKHLESIKSIYIQDCGSSINAKDAYFLSHKRDQSNNGLKATHYSEKVRYSSLPCVLGGKERRRTISNKRYFTKSNSKRLWRDAEWISSLKESVLKDQLSYYIPLAVSRSYAEYPAQKEFLDDKEASNDPEDGSANSEAEYWQNRMKKYNENLTKSPNDIKLWLEFVRMQDKALSYIFDDNKESRKKKQQINTKMLAERKISVLDTAISKNKKALELYLERLECGKLVWENTVLKSEWLDLVETFPRNMDAWRQYLTSWQTHFSIFDMDDVSDAFSFSLRKLLSISRLSPEASHESLKMGQHLVDISVQLAYVWYQGGYMEKAVAFFQSMIEFNFFSPNHLGPLEVEEKLEVFEAFWDSKAPRFGELEAVGWSTFMRKMVPVQFPDLSVGGSNDEEDEILLKKDNLTELWIKLESCRELHHWLPYQGDPDECEDTERMIEFDAIRNHMFYLDSPDDKDYLLEKFLLFLSETKCLKKNHAESPFDVLRLETLTTFTESLDFCQSSTTETFLFPIIGPSITKPESEKYFQFTCEVVRQSMRICGSSKRKLLLIYLIELHATRFTCLSRKNTAAAMDSAQASRKEIKSYLKMIEFRMDLEIFNAFAQYEKVVSGSMEAAKIHGKALSLGLQTVKAFSDDIQLSISLLEHLKCCVQYRMNPDVPTSSEVIPGICSVYLEMQYTPNIAISGGSIMKVRHKLKTFVEDAVKKLDEISKCDELLIYHLFFFCVIQVINSDYDSVSSTVNQTLEVLTLHKKTHGNVAILEQIYTDYIWLIDIMAKIRRLNSGRIMDAISYRSILSDALAISPSNETFLKKYSETQTWRDMLGFNSLRGDSQSVLCIIYRLLPLIEKAKLLIDHTEIGQFSSGHQIEHALESAVKTPEGMSCPLLWRLYLRCCALVRPKGLKDLVYKAINSCPGAKCIYLDSVQLVPEMLEEVARLMEEKKMRIRLPLEELHVLVEDEANSPLPSSDDEAE